jgi:hypothetical protein
MAAGRAALRCDRGVAPMDAKDVNLWHGKLCERWMNHQRGRKEEKGGAFHRRRASPAAAAESGRRCWCE